MPELFLFSEFVTPNLPVIDGRDERGKVLPAVAGRCKVAEASLSPLEYRSVVDALEREQPTMLHICAHGAEGQLMVTIPGVEATALQLGKLLKDLKIKKFKLIFLNACSTSQTARDALKYADCIICYPDKVRNSDATQIAAEFYRRLAEGLTIREAFERAKAACPVGTDRLPPELLGTGGNVILFPKETDPVREYLRSFPQRLAAAITSDAGEQQELLDWLHSGFVAPSGDVQVQHGLPALVILPPFRARNLMPGLFLAAEGRMTGAAERGGAPETSTVDYASNVRDLIQDKRGSMILGEPGAGKTFLLMRLAMDYRDAYWDGRSDLLPVFVPLAGYDGITTDFETFCSRPLGDLADLVPELHSPGDLPGRSAFRGDRPILKVVWFFDALNEMPRGQNQMGRLKTFVVSRLLAKESTARFVLTCRVKNYEDEFRQIDGLYRIDLQDLNPQQIYEILNRVFEWLAAPIWKDVFRAGNLLDAWKHWIETPEAETEHPKDRSVRRFWAYPDDSYRFTPDERARAAVHRDSRQLLLCRNPFTLVRLLLPQIILLLQKGHERGEECLSYVARTIDGSRAALFQSVTEARLEQEAVREKWGADTVERVKQMLERAAAALQETEQRTEMRCADLMAATASEFPDGEDLLLKGAGAGLLTLSQPVCDSTVRFSHQLFQEYYATRHLSDLLNAYDRRYTGWEDGAPLPPPDPGLEALFPNWWDAGAWRVTVPMFGKLQGRKNGISRVVRWLAGYAPEIALMAVLNNNDGMRVNDLAEVALRALIEGARRRKMEPDPVGRAAAYRVLGRLDADPRPGVGQRSDGLPDIAWAESVLPGTYPVGGDEKAYIFLPAEQFSLNYSYEMAKYPVTNAQFQAFVDADERGYNASEYWTAAGLEWKGKRTAPDTADDVVFGLANHPRVNVTWYEAMAFCSWLTARYLELGLEYEVRLPTEIEWEIAARGQAGLVYPYGNDFDPRKGNVYETGIMSTSAVGIFPAGASPFGVLDMSGNVWEWCLTTYAPRSDDREGAAARVCRGGSWILSEFYARAGARPAYTPDLRLALLGFRVVRLPHSKGCS